MEPLAALSIAANVIQLADLSSKIIDQTRELYQNANSSIGETIALLEEATANLEGFLKDLRPSIGSERSSPYVLHQKTTDRKLLQNAEDKQVTLASGLPLQNSDQELLQHAEDSQIAANELLQFLTLVKSQDRGHKRVTFEQIFRGVDGHASLNALEGKLDDIRKQMNITLLSSRRQRLHPSPEHPISETDIAVRQVELLSALENHDKQQTHRHDLTKGAGPLMTYLKADQENDFFKMIIDQLYFAALPERHQAICNAHYNTFEWVFEDPSSHQESDWDNFAEWLSNEDHRNLYWVRGKPGSGKSTLLKFVLNHTNTRDALQIWSQGRSIITAGFFLWNTGTVLQKSREGLLRSLLYTTLKGDRRSLLRIFKQRWQQYHEFGGGRHPFEWSELQSAFETMIYESEPSRNFFFVIDGLDEFDGNPREIVDLVSGLAKHPCVKICVASRPWPEFEDAFRKQPSLRLEQLTRADMRKYVANLIGDDEYYQALSGLEPAAASSLTHIIEQQSQGVFLWVYLMVRSLREGLHNADRVSDLFARLNALPRELEHLCSIEETDRRPVLVAKSPGATISQATILSYKSPSSTNTSSEHTNFSFQHAGSSFAATSLGGMSRMDEQKYTRDENEEDLDYVSIASNENEIASQVSRRMTKPELMAVRMFGRSFTEVEDLQALHKELLAKLGTGRFINNYRKALKNYVLELKEIARTPLEKDTIKVVENRKNRQAIALRIVEHTAPEDHDDRTRRNDPVDDASNRKYLENWARTVYGPPDVETLSTDVYGAVSEDEEESSDEDVDTNELKTLTAINVDQTLDFLRNPAPLRLLILQLRMLLLSTSTQEILSVTPKRALEVVEAANDSSASVLNRCKAWVERQTASHWDWWPLRPCIPILTSGNALLKWELCGKSLYVRLSQDEAKTVKSVLHLMDEHPPECYCCTTTTTSMNWVMALANIYQLFWKLPLIHLMAPSMGTVSLSRAQARYTPNDINTGGSIVLQPQRFPAAEIQSSPSDRLTGTQAHNPAPNTIPPVVSSCVVFGIRDMHGFHDIEHLDTDVQLNDSTFFQQLKESHKKHRWRVQNWLSPYVFRYCRFVQFEELLAECVSCVGEALPDEHGYTDEYEYTPRPPIAKTPLIDPVRFSVLLRACDLPCYWSLLPEWLHKCRRIPAGRRHLVRIPQKKRKCMVSTSRSNRGNCTDRVKFGLQAKYMLSFVRVSIYHIIPILSGFAFWVYWMKHYPKDLQNASVPLFTICMLLGTSWAILVRYTEAS